MQSSDSKGGVSRKDGIRSNDLVDISDESHRGLHPGTGNPPQNFDSARNSHTLGFSRVRLNLVVRFENFEGVR